LSVDRTVVAKKHEKHQKHQRQVEGGTIECGQYRSSDKKARGEPLLSRGLHSCCVTIQMVLITGCVVFNI